MEVCLSLPSVLWGATSCPSGAHPVHQGYILSVRPAVRLKIWDFATFSIAKTCLTDFRLHFYPGDWDISKSNIYAEELRSKAVREWKMYAGQWTGKAHLPNSWGSLVYPIIAMNLSNAPRHLFPKDYYWWIQWYYLVRKKNTICVSKQYFDGLELWKLKMVIIW